MYHCHSWHTLHSCCGSKPCPEKQCCSQSTFWSPTGSLINWTKATPAPFTGIWQPGLILLPVLTGWPGNIPPSPYHSSSSFSSAAWSTLLPLLPCYHLYSPNTLLFLSPFTITYSLKNLSEELEVSSSPQKAVSERCHHCPARSRFSTHHSLMLMLHKPILFLWLPPDCTGSRCLYHSSWQQRFKMTALVTPNFVARCLSTAQQRGDHQKSRSWQMLPKPCLRWPPWDEHCCLLAWSHHGCRKSG